MVKFGKLRVNVENLHVQEVCWFSVLSGHLRLLLLPHQLLLLSTRLHLLLILIQSLQCFKAVWPAVFGKDVEVAAEIDPCTCQSAH